MVIRHKIMLFSIFFNSPNQNFQQCTNVRRAQEKLLLSHYFQSISRLFSLLYLQCLLDLFVNILLD